MVVCAVRYETVSGSNSLLTGKNTGNFANLKPPESTLIVKSILNAGTSLKYPKKEIREFTSDNREAEIQKQGSGPRAE
jgi:hypothetical protein